ncbi:hypothetical protein FHL15_010133 [Xylaria flabelliformis]|uniref:Uncharacterized protein n=1 Tax=Xylaria flabelliformis TaxID=2512241 RepID=A0A553HM31_9PEZI|nr:hypothetical protein FHL15_010133 [Xylaria flabelliformis]
MPQLDFNRLAPDNAALHRWLANSQHPRASMTVPTASALFDNLYPDIASELVLGNIDRLDSPLFALSIGVSYRALRYR